MRWNAAEASVNHARARRRFLNLPEIKWSLAFSYLSGCGWQSSMRTPPVAFGCKKAIKLP